MGTEPNLNNVVSPPRKTNKNRPYRIPQKKDLRKRLPLGYQCGGTRGLQMLFKFKLSMTLLIPEKRMQNVRTYYAGIGKSLHH